MPAKDTSVSITPTERDACEITYLGTCFAWARNQVGRLDAERLLEHALGTTTVQLYTDSSMHIDAESVKRLRELVNRRSSGEPIPYITEECYFWNQKLRVTPSVLIPRPETEVLVETSLGYLQEGDRVLDLGTGSGAIALALRSEMCLRVLASDIDESALNLCKENARRLNLDIEVVQSDWYASITGLFKLISSNPPYVASNDSRLSHSELRFEPRIALASERNGLQALQTVIMESPRFLEKKGVLVVEHGHDQREPVLDLFKKAGFRNIRYRNDYGAHPRVATGERGE